MWKEMCELTAMPIVKIEVPIQLKTNSDKVVKFEDLSRLLKTITKYGVNYFKGWRYV